MIHFKHDVLKIMAGEIADALRPPAPLTPSAWAAANLIVPDGPHKLGRWDPALTPYIAEPLDMIATSRPENELCVMKSAQTGFTTMLLAAIGHTICADQADMMVVLPTDASTGDFNSKKLQPCLEETKATAIRVAKQTSRSAAGSSTYEKKFGRYALTLALASSSADLRSKTIQKAFLDETDEYPDDLDGQGSPFEMVEARQESFLRDGNWKRVKISTPTIKGASAIEAEFEASDKRRWHVRCAQCDGELVFEFGPHFRFDKAWPFNAYYVCPHCGAVIEEAERARMLRTGRWVATAPGIGKKPGFHLDALSSPFVPWAKIAERYVAAADNPVKLKAFYNLTLGLPFEFKGDAPDHVRLLERREDGPPRGHVHERGLMLVAAADVQMRGIWVEVVVFAPNRESWVVDAFYCDGSTESPGSLDDAPDSGNAFSLMLQKTVGREFPDAFGGVRRLDALGIDSGFRTHVVYATVRANQRLHPWTGNEILYALDGREGWFKPPLGSPSLVDINLAGSRVRDGAKLWPVGTWPLKGAFYSDLRKDGRKSGAAVDPPGYCHFPDWLDEAYFRQLTSEYLADETFRGRRRKVWKQRPSARDNHWLDARIYLMALAEHLGLSSITPATWAAIAKSHGAPAPTIQTPAGSSKAATADMEATDEDVNARLERLGKSNAEELDRMLRLGRLNTGRW